MSSTSGLIRKRSAAVAALLLAGCGGGAATPLVMVVHDPSVQQDIDPNLYAESQGLLTLRQGAHVPFILGVIAPELRQVRVTTRWTDTGTCAGLEEGSAGDPGVSQTWLSAAKTDAAGLPLRDPDGNLIYRTGMTISEIHGRPLMLDLTETGVAGQNVPFVKLFVTAVDAHDGGHGVSACYKRLPDTTLFSGGPH